VKITDARAAAFELLLAVFQQRRTLDEALTIHRDLPDLAPRDRALARLLALTVLRRAPELDAMIAPLLRTPLRGRAAPVQNLLRIGAAQLVFLGTPAHAAVATTVAAAQKTGNRAYKGLVNAVLRRLSREGAAPAENPGRVNTPDWLWDCWRDSYGEATAAAIATAHLGEPPLDLTVKQRPEWWAERLEAELLPTGSLRRATGGDVRALPGFAEGAWWVQDAAAALPARLLGDVAGRTVFDLCAAPGGKTAQLAAAGAEVYAVDADATRLKRLEENLARLGLGAHPVAADATQWTPRQPADAVLLDAPCTATGTIRRHPDIARLRRPADVQRLAALQDRLLARTADLLQPGGMLVYATCSLQPEEGPARIAAFLAQGAPFTREAIAPAELPGLEEALTPDGDLRTLPSHWAYRGGIDGFYVARLRRR
jgi:16S rRNA (cytosine967-C5)-methyltransferase